MGKTSSLTTSASQLAKELALLDCSAGSDLQRMHSLLVQLNSFVLSYRAVPSLPPNTFKHPKTSKKTPSSQLKVTSPHFLCGTLVQCTTCPILCRLPCVLLLRLSLFPLSTVYSIFYFHFPSSNDPSFHMFCFPLLIHFAP